MKILLTGSTGFLGSKLLHTIIDKTNYEVFITKRSFSNNWRIKEYLKNNRVTAYNIDKTGLDVIFQKNKINTIIHVATEYGQNDNLIQKTVETNLLFPVRLVELAIKNNVKTFINTDTFYNKKKIYYSKFKKYSMSKEQLLSWLKYVSNKIQVVNVRLEHIYGPHDNDTKFVEMLFQQIALHRINKLKLTSGLQKRDFVFIDDIASAYLTIIKFCNHNEFNYKNFEVGTGVAVEVRQLVKMIKKLSKSPTTLGFGDIDYSPDEIMHSVGNIKPLVKLGWNYNVSLLEGVKKILNIYLGKNTS